MDGKLVLIVLAIFLYIKHTKRYRSKVRSVLHRQVLFLVRERYFARVYTRLLELHALPPPRPPFYYALLRRLLFPKKFPNNVRYLLTLGAHARGLQYSFFLSVCLCVCLCVCFPYSGTSRNQAYIQTAVSATSARYGHEI